jgi:hypothetical protein
METKNRIEISERARQNLQRNAMLRSSGGGGNKYFNPQPGDKAAFLFDAEKVDPVEMEFDGKKVQRFQYTVKDPNTSQEKYWTVSKRTSEQIDAFLSEGHALLKIQRFGLGKDTRYQIIPS